MEYDAAQRRRRRRRVANENRKRAIRACYLCKARKSKCIESTPGRCQRCSRHNLQCRFPKERSPSLQMDDSMPFRLQEVSAAGSIGTPPEEAVPLEGTVPMDTMTDAVAVVTPHGTVRTETGTIMWPQFLAKLRQAFTVEDQQPASGDVSDMVAMQEQVTRPASLRPLGLARITAAVKDFPPRAVADFLLRVCFRHSFDSFFYFDQSQLLDDMHEFYTDTASPLRSDASFVCLAMAVLALASQWTALERPPDEDSADDSAVFVDHTDPGRPFYDHARGLVPDILARPCLRSIEALFVLAVYVCPSTSASSCFIDLGVALRMATASDLHIEIEGSMARDDRAREVRRRLWWSLYAIERCTTVKLNRPRTVDSAICRVPLPAPMPDLDKRQPFDNIHLQIAFVQLIQILDKVADPREYLSDISQPTRTADDENRLRQWKSVLPDEFKQLEDVLPRDPKYRAVFHLHLNYYFSWIVLGKVSLVLLTQATVRYHLRDDADEDEGGSQEASPTLSQQQPSPPPQQPPPQPSLRLRPAMRVDPSVYALARSCAKAATKILRLFEHLARTRNLVRFSFTDFQGCSIATTITLVAGILERDAGYDARVTFGLECLRFMARGNATASITTRFVQAFRSISDDAYRKLQKSASYQQAFQASHRPSAPGDCDGAPSTSVEGRSAADQYRAWAHWLDEKDSTTPTRPRQPQRHAVQGSQQNAEGGGMLPSALWTASMDYQARGPDATAVAWRAPALAVGDSPEDLVEWAPLEAQQLLSPVPPQYSLPVLDGSMIATDVDFLSTPLDEEQMCLLGLTSMDLLGSLGVESEGSHV